ILKLHFVWRKSDTAARSKFLARSLGASSLSCQLSRTQVSSLVDIFIHHTSAFPPILYLKRSGLVGISIAPSKGMSSSSSARSLAPQLAITLICFGWSLSYLFFSYFLHTTFLSCLRAHDPK